MALSGGRARLLKLATSAHSRRRLTPPPCMYQHHCRRWGSSHRPIAAGALDHVCVCVENVEAAIRWYNAVLGLELQHADAACFYPTDPTAPAFLSSSGGVAVALLPLAPRTAPIRYVTLDVPSLATQFLKRTLQVLSLSLSLSLCLSVSVSVSVSLSPCLPVSLPLSVSLPPCLPVSLSLCLSVDAGTTTAHTLQ